MSRSYCCSLRLTIHRVQSSEEQYLNLKHTRIVHRGMLCAAAQAAMDNVQGSSPRDDTNEAQDQPRSHGSSSSGTSETKAAPSEQPQDHQKPLSREQYLAKLQAMADEAAAKHAAARAAAAAQAKAAAAETTQAHGSSNGNAATAAISRQPTSNGDGVAVASSGAGGASKQDGSGGGSSSSVGRATATESRMVPREVAQQAEDQQRRWLEQLNSQVSISLCQYCLTFYSRIL